MRVVHVTAREGLSAVYLPQVVRPMSLLRKSGFDVSLVVFAAIGEFLRSGPRAKWLRQRAVTRNEFGIDLNLLCAPPSRLRRLWSEAFLLRQWLKRNKYWNRPLVLHCRGPVAGDIAVQALQGSQGGRVVFDCRGLCGVEHAYGNGYLDVSDAPQATKSEADRLETMERQVARAADHVICVSQEMSRVVTSRWSVPAAKFTLVPCCTDVPDGIQVATSREQIRSILRLGDRFVVVYCGSLASWQMPDECIHTFQRIRALMPHAHLLVLTTQRKEFAEHLARGGIPEDQTTLLSVPHAEVGRYLSAGDCGLLIRERCLVNEVASPIKFAEYLAAGLPILISEGVGDYSKSVDKYRLGAVLPDLPSRMPETAMRTTLDQLLSTSRAHCRDWAALHLDWAAGIATISKVWLK